MDWRYTAANLFRFLGVDEMARSYGEAELHRTVGELDAKFDAMHEDMQTLAADVKKSLAENQEILRKIDKVENKLDPLPDAVSKHDARLGKLELFDTKLMAVVSLASLTISDLAGGLWMLLTHFTDVIAFMRKLLLGGGP